MENPETAVPTQSFKLEMATQTIDATPPAYIEPIYLNDVIVDGLAGLQLVGGMLHLAFYAESQSFTEKKSVRPIVSRMAMTPQAASLIQMMLKSTLDQMVSNGQIPELPIVVQK